MDKVPIDWLRYVWIIPIVVGFVTFVLTSLFTVYRERKNISIPKRIFIEYAEYELEYPFSDMPKHGEGIVLLGKNGKKLIDYANSAGGSVFTFMVIKNITENDIINLNIKFVFSDRSGKKGATPKEIVNEEFSLPVWKHQDTLYIPATIHDNKTSNFSTSEELVISYTTIVFEHFRYSYKRLNNGEYIEKLKKRYLRFIWLTKVNYKRSGFFSFVRVKNKVEKADK